MQALRHFHISLSRQNRRLPAGLSAEPTMSYRCSTQRPVAERNVQLKMPLKKQETGNIRFYCKIIDGHFLHFFVKFSPTDRKEYTITCGRPGTVLEAIKSSRKYEELKFKDENIVIQLGEEGKAVAVATHFPCSCIREGESLILSLKKRKVEAARDQHYQTVHSRDKYSVFYIDREGGLHTKTKKLFLSNAVKQFKFLCVYGEKGTTVEEALQRDGRFLENLRNFTLSDDENPDRVTECTQRVDDLDGKKFKLCLPRKKRSNINPQDASDDSHRRRERDATAAADGQQLRSGSGAAAANEAENIEEMCEKLREQLPGLKGLMEGRFPHDGKVQRSFCDVLRVRKPQIICITCVRRRGVLQVGRHLSISLLLSLRPPPVQQVRNRYDRATLLQRGERGDEGFFNPVELSSFHRRGGVARGPASAWGVSVQRRPRRLIRRGRLTLPVILFANVQSLVNKVDELLCRIATQRYVRDCSVLCFCETWLGEATPDEAVTPGGYEAFRADRSAADCGKTRGGGTAAFVKQSWCTDTEVISQSCSQDVEYITLRCRPFFLPRRLHSIILSVVYVPPGANEENALRELHDMISAHQDTHPEAAVVVLGDFNHCNLKKTMPKLHQFVNFPTRGNSTLDHCYSNIEEAYTAVPKPRFGRSDHLAILLQPADAPGLRANPDSSTGAAPAGFGKFSDS